MQWKQSLLQKSPKFFTMKMRPPPYMKMVIVNTWERNEYEITTEYKIEGIYFCNKGSIPPKFFTVQLLLQMARCQKLMNVSQMSSTNGFNDKAHMTITWQIPILHASHYSHDVR